MKRETRVQFEDFVEKVVELGEKTFPKECWGDQEIEDVAWSMILAHVMGEENLINELLELLQKGITENLQGHKRIKLQDLLDEEERINNLPSLDYRGIRILEGTTAWIEGVKVDIYKLLQSDDDDYNFEIYNAIPSLKHKDFETGEEYVDYILDLYIELLKSENSY